MYAIAKHFPIKGRREAADRVYDPPAGASGALRTYDKFCPLGVCLYVTDPDSGVWTAPTGYAVSRVIREDDSLEDQAVRFIRDWDSGKITDLAKALGV